MVSKKNVVFSIGIFIVLCFALVAIQMLRFGSFGNSASIWIFNVGQGDAIFLDADVDVLIDGGPTDQIVEKLSHVLPFWDRTIDFIINTHPHADHLTGLVSVLKRYFVDVVWVTGQVYVSPVADLFSDLTKEQEEFVQYGKKYQVAPDVSLTVVWPISDLEGVVMNDANDGSLVIIVTCYGTRILLTGDLGSDQEKMIMNSVGDVDVLKVSHHGSAYSSDLEFLSVIDPEVAIISVGENDYGQPDIGALQRLQAAGAEIYRTDQDGDIRVVCSPQGYEVKIYGLQ